MLKVFSHHNIFVARILIIILQLSILCRPDQIGLPYRIRVFLHRFHQRIVRRPPGTEKRTALSVYDQFRNICHRTEHKAIIQQLLFIQFSHSGKCFFYLRLNRPVNHCAVLLQNPLLRKCIVGCKNCIQLKFITISCFSGQIGMAHQADGVAFSVISGILFHKCPYDLYSLLHGIRRFKPKLVHPVPAQPQQIRAVSKAWLRKRHQPSVDHRRIQRRHLVAVIHRLYSVAGAVFQCLAQISNHSLFGKPDQSLPIFYDHDIRKLSRCDRHINVCRILILHCLEYILVLDI